VHNVKDLPFFLGLEKTSIIDLAMTPEGGDLCPVGFVILLKINCSLYFPTETFPNLRVW
jgi:hypothetical protein